MKRITSIEPQKRHKGRYNLYIDDVFAMGIDEGIIIKYSLAKEKEVSESFLEDIIKAEEINKAFNYAINLLSFRSRSQREIETKMKQKGYEENTIQKVIEKLLYYGYLNDYQFSVQLVNDKQKFKKAGKNLLKQELYQKGIDREIIDQIIEEKVNDDEEYERALELAYKKIKTISKDDKNTKYRKLSGLLARKGYSFDIISKVTKEVI